MVIVYISGCKVQAKKKTKKKHANDYRLISLPFFDFVSNHALHVGGI